MYVYTPVRIVTQEKEKHNGNQLKWKSNLLLYLIAHCPRTTSSLVFHSEVYCILSYTDINADLLISLREVFWIVDEVYLKALYTEHNWAGIICYNYNGLFGFTHNIYRKKTVNVLCLLEKWIRMHIWFNRTRIKTN